MPKNRSIRLIFALVVCIALFIIGRNFYFRHLNNRLVAAVETKNVAEVRSLLNRGADPNTEKQDVDGFGKVWRRSLLDLALSGNQALSDNGAIVCLLIEHGEDIREGSPSNQYHLQAACRAGSLMAVRCLLQHGANAMAEDSNHRTPLRETIQFINTKKHSGSYTVGMEIIRLLEQKGAHLTPWQALSVNDIDTLRAALNKGIGLEARETANAYIVGSNSPGPTLLQEAVWDSNKEAVEFLLQRGADINAMESKTDNIFVYSPLALALLHEDKGMARLLMAHGADVNGRAQGSEAPLLVAIETMPEFVPEMLQHGADLKREGVPALCAAMRAQHDRQAKRTNYARSGLSTTQSDNPPKITKLPEPPDLVALLLKKGVRCQGHAGHAAVSAALQYRPDLVPLFLSQGTSARETSQEKDSLLWTALHYNREMLILSLLRAGANVNAIHGDSTPLLEAIGQKPSLVKMLLDKGADPNKVVGVMPPALCVAAQTGNIEAVKLLLQHGANVNLTGKVLQKGKAGRTPLYYAHKHHHAEIVALLQQAGGRE